MKNAVKIKKLVVISILAAIIIVLQVMGNLFGALFANGLALGLIPIAIGAILYGPRVGLLLGLTMSIVIMAHPQNYTLMSTLWDNIKLIIIMVVKTPLAGFVCGLLFDLFMKLSNKASVKRNKIILILVGIVVSSISVVLVNTLTYVILMLIFFTSGNGFNLNNLVNQPLDENGTQYNSVIAILLLYQVGFNFIIEILISAFLSPAIITIIRILTNKYEMGYKYNFKELNEKEVE